MSSIPIKIDPIMNHTCPMILLATDAHIGEHGGAYTRMFLLLKEAMSDALWI